MKYHVLFSLKNNKKVFMNVVCCSRDWRFKGYFRDKSCMLQTGDPFWEHMETVKIQF